MLSTARYRRCYGSLARYDPLPSPLSALGLWLAQYHIGLQLLAFVIIAPYMSIARWREDFVPPALHKPVSSTWYVYFAHLHQPIY